jgi:hypothetical protein
VLLHRVAQCQRALKGIVSKLTHLPALDAMVHRPLPEGIMKMVLEQARSLSGTRARARNVWASVARCCGSPSMQGVTSQVLRRCAITYCW